MPRPRKTKVSEEVKTKTVESRKLDDFDYQNITYVCRHVHRSEATVLDLHFFKGFPLVYVENNWCAMRDEVDEWMKDNKGTY